MSSEGLLSINKVRICYAKVAPLGHIEKPKYFLDEMLLDYEIVWCAGGTPNSLFKIKSENLLQAINPEIVKLI